MKRALLFTHAFYLFLAGKSELRHDIKQVPYTYFIFNLLRKLKPGFTRYQFFIKNEAK